MKRLLLAVLIVLLTLQMVACYQPNFFDGAGSSTDDASSTRPSQNNVVEKLLDNPIDSMLENEAVPLDSPQLMPQKFSDNSNNYFYIKLGTVKNVLTFCYNAYMYDGRLNPVYEWKTTEVTENLYSRLNEQTIINNTKTETVANLNTKVSADAKATYGGLSASVSSEVSAGLQTTLSFSTSESFSEQFSETLKTSVENVKSTTYTFTPGMDIGYYRYSYYSDFDVYAALVCNRTTKNTRYVYVTVPVNGNSKEGFRYSETGSYAQANTSDLALTADMLNSLNIDFFSSELDKSESFVYAKAHYENFETIKITDQGLFGLEQTDKRDTLDLSSIPEDYFNSEYIFTFKVTVKSKCDKFLGSWVDGKHEMHLYNQYHSNVSNTYDYLNKTIVKNSYGWILEQGWTQRDGNDTFTWEVDGDLCEPVMYILYDASGEDVDTWFRQSIYIDITVTKK